MTDIQTRALMALGYDYEGDDENSIDWVSDANGAFRQRPNKEELIGMLLAELNRLVDGSLMIEGLNWRRPINLVHILYGPQGKCVMGESYLEALTAAVEVAKEKP